MPRWSKSKREQLRSLSEKEVQHHLYGDINAKLEPIRREIDKTRKRLYHLKRSSPIRYKKTFRFAITAIIFAPIVLAFINGGKWFANFKNINTELARPDISAKYTIQTAVYKNKKDAEVFSKTLTLKGYPAFINLYYSKKDSPKYRVCVGKIKDRKEAKPLLEKLRKEKGAAGSFLINLPKGRR